MIKKMLLQFLLLSILAASAQEEAEHSLITHSKTWQIRTSIKLFMTAFSYLFGYELTTKLPEKDCWHLAGLP